MIPNPLDGDASLEQDGDNGNANNFICGVVEGKFPKYFSVDCMLES